MPLQRQAGENSPSSETAAPTDSTLTLQLDGVATHLLPLITGADAPYQNKVRILLRPYPQPWHSSSPLVCEAAVAVARLAAPQAGDSYDAEWKALCDPNTNAAWIFALELMKAQG